MGGYASTGNLFHYVGPNTQQYFIMSKLIRLFVIHKLILHELCTLLVL